MPTAIPAAVAALFAFAAAPASAGETVCQGRLSGSHDNVRVSDGRTCMMSDARLNGNIVVGTGATLSTQFVSVSGNIQGEGARDVMLGKGTRVGGNVQLKQGGSAAIKGVDVGGDIQLDANSGRMQVGGNRVGGNVQVVGNRGGVELIGNQIAGALQCKENTPDPSGAGNRAGDREGQCAGL